MRLINAKTLKLEEFYDAETRPEYAILSHRWVPGEEVSFQDMQRGSGRMGSGWSKIQFCCQEALKHGYNYAWVDTCCIDKTSSAELSEAINSMFDWYSAAASCYVYLMDVDTPEHQFDPVRADAIVRSNWFTRAWTLQELIAPIRLTFYDAHFRRLGRKEDIAGTIERFTKIPTVVLLLPSRVYDYPVAVRMSWAASRKASRLEDIAYSLFGLFEVNLPLLYGEGKRAFVRLQEEIIRRTDDHSIFAWNPGPGEHMPLLALSPCNFEHSGDISLIPENILATPYAMTNMGLSIELQTVSLMFKTRMALLNCRSAATGNRCAIFLTPEDDRNLRWHRIKVNGKGFVTTPRCDDTYVRLSLPTDAPIQYQFRAQRMYIVNPGYLANVQSRLHGMIIDAASFLNYDRGTRRPYTLVSHNNRNDQFIWELRTLEGSLEFSVRLGKPQLTGGMLGMILFDNVVQGVQAIQLAFDPKFRPVVILATHTARLDPIVVRGLQERPHWSVGEFRQRIFGSVSVSPFWTLGLDGLDITSYKSNARGSFTIEKGVHAFVAGGTGAHHSHKPYENAPWHIELGFATKSSEHELYWEFSMSCEPDLR